jgi:serine/threonine-protein kinase
VIGSTAGSYRIIDVLSVGGMGTVYRAEHTLIGRLAAVKVLNPAMSVSTDIIERFFNEARATTLIKHPGIVEVYDFGYLESGNAYLVMEFLEGRTLDKRNKARGPIAAAEAAALLRAVCGPLAAAHAKGIVHRDLKPDNIFLVPDAESPLGERPKLLDFGIAKLTDIGLAGTATKTGSLMGTPTYMSPEQCRGTGDVDHRADIYSLGCIFFELVTGRPPFIERGAGELIASHLFVDPEPPSRFASVSPHAEQLILAMISKQAAQRPQSAYDLAHLLSEVATRGGFATSTSWERPSMPLIPMPDGRDGRDGRGSSPSLGGLAATPTPSHLMPTMMPSIGHTPMPLHGPPSTPMPGNRYTPPPTPTGPLANGTRVSTGSDSRTPAPATSSVVGRSRRLGLVAIGGLLAVAGVIAVVVAMQKGGDATTTPQASGAPTTTPSTATTTAPATTTATSTPPTTETQPPTTAATTTATPTATAGTPTTTKTTKTTTETTTTTAGTPTTTKTTTTAGTAHPPRGTSRTSGKPTGTRPKKPRQSESTDPLLETDL